MKPESVCYVALVLTDGELRKPCHNASGLHNASREIVMPVEIGSYILFYKEVYSNRVAAPRL